ncbi:MAG: hypothetical protein ISF22_06215 [Methanomassiliicoccus sp.]|nr:hypothetical protein [Methanomassiliicoccus sp.]
MGGNVWISRHWFFLSFLFIAALGIIPIVYAYYLPPKMDERCLRSVEAIEQQRAGRAKRYIIHYGKWRWTDQINTYGFVGMGLVLVASPILVGLFDKWEAVDLNFVGVAAFGGMIFVLAFPLAWTIATFVNTANIEVVTDQGIEVWRIRRGGVRHEYTAEWREIKKVWVSPSYRSFSGELMTIFTLRGEFDLLTKWPNMLAFLKDLHVFAPEKILKADDFTQARIKYQINDPDSSARKGALR